MAERVLLLVSVPSEQHLLDPKYLSHAIELAVSQSRRSLLVVVFSNLFAASGPYKSKAVEHWKDIQRFLTFFYVTATTKASQMNNVLLNVEVVVHDASDHDVERYELGSHDAVFVFDIDGGIPLDDLPTISAIPTTVIPPLSPPIAPSEPLDYPIVQLPIANLPDSFPVSALGGTFDHLHAGHKILLSVAAWLTTRKVIVGVTDEALLKKKSNAHLLESISERIEAVRRFLVKFKPALEYDIVPIDDVYGPTATDPDIQAIVLSFETREGAAAIAKLREERQLPTLEPFVIDVISSSGGLLQGEDLSNAEKLKSGKMGSTAIRQWIADNQTKSDEQ